ncbi:MAG: hypothetical protein GY792_25630 [Gammaproteobacteria bacterium]|nr:hypothetical protein [Gammaproteobacteria bacterium]
MIEHLDQAVQNALTDLLSASLSPAFDGKGVTFPTKTIGGKKYIYVAAKVGSIPMQRYLGPDDAETRALLDQERELWKSSETSRITRARLVNMILVGGALGPTPQEGKVLRLLERGGVFIAGGVLVGTPAFRTLGSMLGVAWEGQFATRDVDIAAEYKLPVAVKQKPIDLKSIILESKMGFLEIPTLNRKHPSTSYKMKGGDFKVELLTPERGKPSNQPILIRSLRAMAEPLRYLDYLIQETQPAVVPFGIGVLVNVPDPGRFAIHKLVVSQRRPANAMTKSVKDIDQARQLLEVLIDIRPGSIYAAIEAANSMDKKFMRQCKAASKQLPGDIQKALTA